MTIIRRAKGGTNTNQGYKLIVNTFFNMYGWVVTDISCGNL